MQKINEDNQGQDTEEDENTSSEASTRSDRRKSNKKRKTGNRSDNKGRGNSGRRNNNGNNSNKGMQRSFIDPNVAPSVVNLTSAVPDLIGHLDVGTIPKQFSYDPRTIGSRAPVVFRYCLPYAAIIGGWDSTYHHDDPTYDLEADPSVDVLGRDSNNPALDNTIGNAGDTLYAQTYDTGIFSTVIWPTLDAFLKSGLGSRQNVNLSAFVRYLTRLLLTSAYLTTINNIRNLLLNPPPGTHPIFSEHLTSFCIKEGFYDSGTIARLNRLMQQVKDLPMFPRLQGEINRMLAPYFAQDGSETLHIPCALSYWDVTTFPQRLSSIEADINYIRGNLSSQLATIQSFIPTTLEMSGFGIYTPPVVDVIKGTGAWNSSCIQRAITGDNASGISDYTGLYIQARDIDIADLVNGAVNQVSRYKPIRSDQVGSRDEQGYQTSFETMMPELLAAEVLSSSIWMEGREGLDSYMLITPHLWGTIFILNPVTDSYHTLNRDDGLYKEFYHLGPQLNYRWKGYKTGSTSPEITQGRITTSYDPRYLSADIDLNGIFFATRTSLEHAFHYPELSAIAVAQLGRAVRVGISEIRNIFLK